jgi:hypothetical protein
MLALREYDNRCSSAKGRKKVEVQTVAAEVVVLKEFEGGEVDSPKYSLSLKKFNIGVKLRNADCPAP